MPEEQEPPAESPEAPAETELPEIDYTDPLKRDEEEAMPGIDPVVLIPPESRIGPMVSPYVLSWRGRRSREGGELHG
jgi:hypothetical protein